ncbi:MAG: hypothetical protein QOG53_1320 [Frankiales bacterium]|nr:hypothetical protein [Frankiales bacterium]
MDLTTAPAVHGTGIDRRRAMSLGAALATVSALWLYFSDTDRLVALSGAADQLGASIAQVPWVVVAASALALALATIHYVLAAVAIRASSGAPLPLGEATLSQLASSVLNRVAPGGVGGMVVNTRYLSRHGLPMGGALTAVGALGVLGGVADLLGTGLLLFGGHWIGLGGGTRELHVLAGAGMHWAPTKHLVTMGVAAAVLAGLATAAYVVIRRHRRARGKDTEVGAHAWRHIAALARRPRRASTLLLASAGTTFVLAFAFAIVVQALVGTAAPSLAALMVVYLVGAAAASAVHIPAIAGPTEIALTAALVASGVAAGPALVSVLLFRGLTFWAPVPVGLFAVRALRRRGAL